MRLLAAGAAALAALLGVGLWLGLRPEHPPARSIAVMPFLDLTSEAMEDEYVADGVTEALVDRLAAVPGLRVAPPTSSFALKGKQESVADIAKALHVAYVVDGSIRKSGTALRTSVRLVRTEDGFVIWTADYETKSDEVLKTQDEIASGVARALQERI
jgi:TolB-like protein